MSCFHDDPLPSDFPFPPAPALSLFFLNLVELNVKIDY